MCYKSARFRSHYVLVTRKTSRELAPTIATHFQRTVIAVLLEICCPAVTLFTVSNSSLLLVSNPSNCLLTYCFPPVILNFDLLPWPSNTLSVKMVWRRSDLRHRQTIIARWRTFVSFQRRSSVWSPPNKDVKYLLRLKRFSIFSNMISLGRTRILDFWFYANWNISKIRWIRKNA